MTTFKVNKKYRPFMRNLYAVAVENWTDSAIMCFQRCCVCKGCPLNGAIESVQCHMKIQVLELVRTIGLPKDVKTKGILENEG